MQLSSGMWWLPEELGLKTAMPRTLRAAPMPVQQQAGSVNVKHRNVHCNVIQTAAQRSTAQHSMHHPDTAAAAAARAGTSLHTVCTSLIYAVTTCVCHMQVNTCMQQPSSRPRLAVLGWTRCASAVAEARTIQGACSWLRTPAGSAPRLQRCEQPDLRTAPHGRIVIMPRRRQHRPSEPCCIWRLLLLAYCVVRMRRVMWLVVLR